MRWALVRGDRGKDKSALAADLARRMSAAGMRVGGVVQRSDASGEHKVHDVVRVRDGTTRRIAWSGGGPKEGEPGVCSFCSLLFDARAFADARDWLREDARSCDAVFVDEVGKFEVSGRGHREALVEIVASRDPLVILGVRSEPLFSVVETFALGDAVASIDAPATDAERDAFVDAVRRAATRA